MFIKLLFFEIFGSFCVDVGLFILFYELIEAFLTTVEKQQFWIFFWKNSLFGAFLKVSYLNYSSPVFQVFVFNFFGSFWPKNLKKTTRFYRILVAKGI